MNLSELFTAHRLLTSDMQDGEQTRVRRVNNPDKNGTYTVSVATKNPAIAEMAEKLLYTLLTTTVKFKHTP